MNLQDCINNYNPNKITMLCEIMKLYGSDKGLGWHNYTSFYHELFKDIKKPYIFELGIGTTNTSIPSNMGMNGIPGASLKGWKQYFNESIIYGADIDHNILFSEDRILTFYCDQRDKDVILSMWSNILQTFDIIIDDGLHDLKANICFFENSIHKLNVGGIYIIEDVNGIELYKEAFEVIKKKYKYLDIHIVKIPHSYNTVDNCLICIQRLY